MRRLLQLPPPRFADSVDRTCGNRLSTDVAQRGSCTRMCAVGFSLGGLPSTQGGAIEFSSAGPIAAADTH